MLKIKAFKMNITYLEKVSKTLKKVINYLKLEKRYSK